MPCSYLFFSLRFPPVMLVSGRRGVRSIFQPTFGFNGGLERSARTRFRGCRFGSLSQSLVSQLPVRPVTINLGQGEHKGRRRVSIGNTLTAEVSLDFIVPEGHSVKVVRLPSFVERRSGELVLRQNINLSKLLLNSLNAPRAISKLFFWPCFSLIRRRPSGLTLEMGEAAASITQQRPLIARYAWPVGAAPAKPRDYVDDRISSGRRNETRSLS